MCQESRHTPLTSFRAASEWSECRLGMKCDAARNSKSKGGGEKGTYFLGKTSVPFLKRYIVVLAHAYYAL